MSQRIRKNITFLQLLLSTHRPQKKALLNTISTDQVKAIGEIALNILHGVIPLTAKQKKLLSRYKDTIRVIGHKKKSQRRKKTVLVKNIKALELLLKSVEPILKSL